MDDWRIEVLEKRTRVDGFEEKEKERNEENLGVEKTGEGERKEDWGRKEERLGNE